MKTKMRRFTAWLMTLLLVLTSVSALADDEPVNDYSESIAVSELTDDTATYTVTFTWDDEYTSHIWMNSANRWAKGTDKPMQISVSAGSTIGMTDGASMPNISIRNLVGSDVTYQSIYRWADETGKQFTANTVVNGDKTVYLTLFQNGQESVSLNFVCSCDSRHTVYSGSSLQLQYGQSLSEDQIPPTATPSKYCADYPDDGNYRFAGTWHIAKAPEIQLTSDIVFSKENVGAWKYEYSDSPLVDIAADWEVRVSLEDASGNSLGEIWVAQNAAIGTQLPSGYSWKVKNTDTTVDSGTVIGTPVTLVGVEAQQVTIATITVDIPGIDVGNLPEGAWEALNNIPVGTKLSDISIPGFVPGEYVIYADGTRSEMPFDHWTLVHATQLSLVDFLFPHALAEEDDVVQNGDQLLAVFASTSVYTASFDMNSSYVKTSTDSVVTNEAGVFTFPEPSTSSYDVQSGKTTTHYVFSGWSMTKGNTESLYQPGDQMTISADTTYYATWSKAYKVTFSPGNGATGNAYVVWTDEKGNFTVPTLDETGLTLKNSSYVFLGWGTNSSNSYGSSATVLNPNVESTVTSDTTYYPVYTTGGSVTAYYFIRTDGVIQAEPASYTASAYYPQTSNGGTAFTLTGTIQQAIAINNNLSAVQANVGSGAPSEVAIKNALAGSGIDYNENDYEIIWYVIKYDSGWHVDGVIRDKTKYWVFYDVNGGQAKPKPDDQEYAAGTTVAVDFSQNPVRTGYTFLGWDEDKNATVPTYPASVDANFVMPANHVYLYAIWKPNTDVQYKVEHYLQQSNGNFSHQENDDRTYTGTTGATVTAQQNTYSGYSYDHATYSSSSVEEGNGLSATLAADGTLVFKLYYTRDTGNLTVQKTVVDQYFEAGERTFSFVVSHGEDVTDAEFTAWADEKGYTVLNDNTVTITVTVDATSKSGSTMLIDLPTGTYVLRESSSQAYTVSPASSNTVTVTKSATATVGVTNTRKTTSVTAKKVWVDNENQSNHRPDAITLTLTAKSGNTDYDLSDDINTAVVVNADTDWMTTWNGLPQYALDGTELVYSISESASGARVGDLSYYTASPSIGTNGELVITNTLAYEDVVISKEVNGSLGDRTKSFNFTIAIGSEATPVSFTLKHGESYTVQKVLIGTTVTVTETNDGYSVKNAAGGEIASETDGRAVQTISVSASEHSITFVNVKDVTPDTGIVLDSLPYIVILAVVALGVVLMVRKRRHYDD